MLWNVKTIFAMNFSRDLSSNMQSADDRYGQTPLSTQPIQNLRAHFLLTTAIRLTHRGLK
jgi:hypothetical protein